MQNNAYPIAISRLKWWYEPLKQAKAGPQALKHPNGFANDSEEAVRPKDHYYLSRNKAWHYGAFENSGTISCNMVVLHVLESRHEN